MPASTQRDPGVVVIGAGPAGLTAALELTGRGVDPLVLEATDRVGGIARTETYRGFRFDIGGHRFYTKIEPVQELWEELLGDEFLEVPRLSRIYYEGDFYSYPLDLFNVVGNLGLVESFRMLGSYLYARVRPRGEEATFEDWVVNRFGWRLYETFFRTYTEKVWGVSCQEIRADWAAQRIRDLSFAKALANAVFGNGDASTLIRTFRYPVRGPGMMWERCRERVVEAGGEVRFEHPVVRIRREGDRVRSLVVDGPGGETEIPADAVISSMPITELVTRLDPPAPEPVLEAARGLKYRAFVLAGLIVDGTDHFPDNWVYVHVPDVKVGRIQNFRNWSEAMAPAGGQTNLGMEYFCDRGDEIWSMDDGALLELATRELDRLGLVEGVRVTDGVVFRQPRAYPVYDRGYRERVDEIAAFVDGLENLQTIGRNGMHRYNNQDHSMLTAMLAVENLHGADHDLWRVNTERSYYEEFEVRNGGDAPGGEPQAAGDGGRTPDRDGQASGGARGGRHE